MKTIFVTVGNDFHSFYRLIEKIDEQALKSKYQFIVQYGYSKYIPKNIPAKYGILSRDEYYDKFRSADMIISHAGIGTIMDGIQMKKRMIVIPRLHKFGEHFNDHQLEIVSAIGENYENIKIINDVSLLESCINELFSKNIRFPNPPDIKSLPLIKEIKYFIENEKAL